jgi:hypothetical protein
LWSPAAPSLGDLVITAMFNLYQYHPGLLSGRTNNYLGVLMAECLFVPCVFAALGAVHRWARPLIFGLMPLPMMLIEELFLWLGIYKHHGWATWLSGMLFFVYGLCAAWWADAFEQAGHSRVHRAVLIAASVYYTMNLYGLIPFGILRLAEMHAGISANQEQDLVLTSLLLHAVPFTITAFLTIWFRKAGRFSFLALIAAGFTIWLTLLWWLGIWSGRWPWNPLFAGLLVALVIYGLGQLDAWFARYGTYT